MLRLFTRGGWGKRLPALLAAGTLGVVGAARAEAPCPPGDAGAACRPACAPACEAHGRLQEIKVELALLADAVTFPWKITAHVEGKQLKLKGEVPGDSVRQRAAALARQCTAMPVVDRTWTSPVMAAPPPEVPAQELVGGTMKVLREVLGERAGSIEVGTRAGGHITLRGVVPSYEEKLALSSRLRSVHGCACVANLLTVAPVLHEGRAVVPVSTDGTKVVSVSRQGTPVEAPQQAKAAVPMTWSPPVAMTKVDGPAPRPLPGVSSTALPAGAVSKAPPMAKTAWRMPWKSVVKPASHPGAPRTAETVIATADAMEKFPEPIAASSTGGTPAVLPTYPATASPYFQGTGRPSAGPVYKASPSPGAVATAAANRLPPGGGSPYGKYTAFAPEGPAPAAAPVARTAVTWSPAPAPVRPSRAAPAPASASKPGKLSSLIQSGATALRPSAPTKKGSGSATKAVASAPRPLVLPAAKPMGKPAAKPAAAADEPVVSTGMIIFHDDQADAPAAPAAGAPTPMATSPGELQHKVRTICAGFAKDVQVVAGKDKSWQVKVTVGSTATADELSTKLLNQLPEMLEPHIRLSMEVAP